MSVQLWVRPSLIIDETGAPNHNNKIRYLNLEYF